jgi:thiol-disulfide isomerase/thioredoxin
VKLHTFAVNHIAQWAIKNGKKGVDQGSPEFQGAFREAFFAAADVLADKDSIFQMLLLQAKSGREMSADEKRGLAKRVAEHPKASASIKAEAERILSGAPAYAVGKPLELSFTAVDGTRIDLKDLAGKVVLIDFWATWCGPCVAEVPNLKKVYETYHPKGFEILGISLDDKKGHLLAFTKKHEMPWPQYFDGKHWNNEISFRFGISSVPTTWLVDKKGVLRYTDGRHQVESAVQRLLKED